VSGSPFVAVRPLLMAEPRVRIPLLPGALQIVAHQHARQRRKEVNAAVLHRPDRCKQVVGGSALRDVSRRAGRQHLEEILVVLVHGQRQHHHVRAALLDAPGRLDSVHVGHRDVHQHDIGRQLLSKLQGLGARLGLTHDFHAGVSR